MISSNDYSCNSYLILIPKKESNLYDYASVFHEQAFFIFGGYGFNSLSRIGRLDAVTRTWSLAGSLIQSRRGHAVVFDGSQFLVIGGTGYYQTEYCVPNGVTITCTQNLGLGLYNYAYYPELMLVDDNYGKDC